jgi:putative transposase
LNREWGFPNQLNSDSRWQLGREASSQWFEPLSLDIRKRMAKAVSVGASRNSVAKRFDVAASTVIKLMQHAKATGSLVPKRMGGYRKYKLAAHDELVRELVKATPDATLGELVEDLGKRGIETSWTLRPEARRQGPIWSLADNHLHRSAAP